jgi:hypothetical protein
MISQGCAVAKPNRCIYYFEIANDYTDGIDTWKKGVYSAEGYMGAYYGWQTRTKHVSNRIWRQGPKGGVKIVKGRGQHGYAYVTKDEEMMKKFIWAKLSAQPIK